MSPGSLRLDVFRQRLAAGPVEDRARRRQRSSISDGVVRE